MTTLAQHEGLQPYAEAVFSGAGAAVSRLRLQVARIAPHYRIALLTGETGTGKQTIARELHRLSPVARQPFVVTDANQLGGQRGARTVFVAGLENLNSEAQVRFVRVLRLLDRETRLIVASCMDLKGMVSAGRMRQDLYEATCALEIKVAPLRDRLEDFNVLANALLRPSSGEPSFQPEALLRMRRHSWPGNLAELHQVCLALGEPGAGISAADLPPLAPMVASEPVRLEVVVRRHVMDVLQGCSGNKLRAAELLGISRSTLYRMLDSTLL